MKKAMLRKLRGLCNKYLGEEKTNEIIKETTEKVVSDLLEETKPKAKKKTKEVK